MCNKISKKYDMHKVLNLLNQKTNHTLYIGSVSDLPSATFHRSTLAPAPLQLTWKEGGVGIPVGTRPRNPGTGHPSRWEPEPMRNRADEIQAPRQSRPVAQVTGPSRWEPEPMRTEPMNRANGIRADDIRADDIFF